MVTIAAQNQNNSDEVVAVWMRSHDQDWWRFKANINPVSARVGNVLLYKTLYF